MFSYNANWNSAGRWYSEFLTKRGKYILCPLEKLFFQKRGSLKIKEVVLRSRADKKFKPGFYLQTISFIKSINDDLLSLSEYNGHMNYYKKIAGYNR